MQLQQELVQRQEQECQRLLELQQDKPGARFCAFGPRGRARFFENTQYVLVFVVTNEIKH